MKKAKRSLTKAERLAGRQLEERGERCPTCGSFDTGTHYGLLGGGIGTYLYCDGCGLIISKSQEVTE